MNDTAHMLTVRIPLHVRKRGGRKTMIAPDALAMPARVDVTLVKALARAFRWRRMLEDGSYSPSRSWRWPKRSTRPTCAGCCG